MVGARPKRWGAPAPDSEMDASFTAHLQAALAVVPAGAEVDIAILRIRMPAPDGEERISVIAELVAPTPAQAAPQPEVDLAILGPADRLRAYIDKHGDALRKERDWGKGIEAGGICMRHDLSAREIERARIHVPIPYERKDDGLDAGAVMIRASDLLAYLESRERIQSGNATAPAWWEEVVPGRFRGKLAA